VKGLALSVLTSSALRGLFRRWTERTVPIVMLHRFSSQGRPGTVRAADLEQSLTLVRDSGLRPLCLGDLADRLAVGSVPPRSVCFTVDDGYRDFAEVAWPVFRRFDVPVTVFLISGFVDGTAWNWWDRISYTLAAAGNPDRRVSEEALIESCKEVPDERKQEIIHELERDLDVEVPTRPPEEFSAMDWETVRRLSREGVEFGAHTVTHPILSRVDDARVRSELEGSVAAVRDATGVEVRSFAYPNGRDRDFDARSILALRELGVRAAVTTEYGIVDRATLAGADALCRLPRVVLGEDARRRVALFSGLEAAKISVSRK
jgi:peptidoglycan/xylan/chitin deacetylase (PgdA/CDA1 family)